MTLYDHAFRMVAYRAENIQTRLEPQEFYERIEIEESIQNEVLLQKLSCKHNGYMPYLGC